MPGATEITVINAIFQEHQKFQTITMNLQLTAMLILLVVMKQ